ncbi:hypothetical protein ACJX0J_007728, partial [Zea mays]
LHDLAMIIPWLQLLGSKQAVNQCDWDKFFRTFWASFMFTALQECVVHVHREKRTNILGGGGEAAQTERPWEEDADFMWLKMATCCLVQRAIKEN